MAELPRENQLLGWIQGTNDPEKIARYIAELESIPAKSFQFHERWYFIHGDCNYSACWTDEGYDPAQSPMPRDIQLLSATRYGYEDILNGGFHQFFWNPGGVFAPEMEEWFARTGLSDVASIMRKAMKLLQPLYSRSREQRMDFLDAYTQEHLSDSSPSSDWNPFDGLDDKFYTALPRARIYQAADIWLRDVCGITSLAQSYDAPR